MRFVIIFLALAQIALASNEWEDFKSKFRKTYRDQEEEKYRREIFYEKLKLVEEHNKKFEQGLSTYTININKYADLRNDEIFPAIKRNKEKEKSSVKKSINHRISPREEVPDSMDWRNYGVIADQKICETCWAFAIVATIEAHWAIYKKENISLSQQNLADCVDPTFTCQTDLERDMVEKTYQYIIDNGGIDTLEAYPFEFYTVGACAFKSESVGATIKSYVNVTEGDEEELKRIVGTVGPVTVVITTDTLWSAYRSGVYYNPTCNDNFNHVVVIVGYGTENGEDYWLVKNSWGEWFGEDGYIKMARNKDNNCGIATIARYPIV